MEPNIAPADSKPATAPPASQAPPQTPAMTATEATSTPPESSISDKQSADATHNVEPARKKLATEHRVLKPEVATDPQTEVPGATQAASNPAASKSMENGSAAAKNNNTIAGPVNNNNPPSTTSKTTDPIPPSANPGPDGKPPVKTNEARLVKQEIASAPAPRKPAVSFYFIPELSTYEHGKYHLMKPFRANLAYQLLNAFKVFGDRVELMHHPKLASKKDLAQFHSDHYLCMLQLVEDHLETTMLVDVQDSVLEYINNSMTKYNLSLNREAENHGFVGIVDYCRLVATGSLAAAAQLNAKATKIAVNWFGGHAQATSTRARRGCYVNDCVLAILELLKVHDRVVYIDLDFLHCTGVEEAFYSTDRVLTVSFHGKSNVFDDQGEDGPGQFADTGYGDGKGYAVNLPVQGRLDDEGFLAAFTLVIQAVKDKFDPSAVVLQCGCGGLAGDWLGRWNLSVKGLGECVRVVKNLNLPLLALGGGGANLGQTARAWAWFTAILADAEDLVTNDIPEHNYRGYYGPDFKILRPPVTLDDKETTDRKKLLASATHIQKNLASLQKKRKKYTNGSARAPFMHRGVPMTNRK